MKYNVHTLSWTILLATVVAVAMLSGSVHYTFIRPTEFGLYVIGFEKRAHLEQNVNV